MVGELDRESTFPTDDVKKWLQISTFYKNLNCKIKLDD